MARHAPIFHNIAQAAGIKLRANVARPWLTCNGHLKPEIGEQLPADVVKALGVLPAEVLNAGDGCSAARGGVWSSAVVVAHER